MHTKSSIGTSDALDVTDLAASLTVRDLAASARWYTDVVGFTTDRRHERDGRLVAVSLRAGHVRLLLTQDDGAQGDDRAKGVGFSLQLTTAQDIDAIAARMASRGGVLDSPPMSTPWGVRVFRFRDPDGFRFTMSSPAHPLPAGKP
jgi:uncharacterized glyoxalase superfamily protein PhnB